MQELTDIIKKPVKITVKTENCEGNFLGADAKREYIEDFIDDDTGEVVSIERFEIIASKGVFINSITKRLLIDNNINEVIVSDMELTGDHIPEISLFEVHTIITNRDKKSTCIFITIASTLSQAEELLIDHLEQHAHGYYKITKICSVKYDKILKVDYNDIKRLKDKDFKWFKSVIQFDSDNPYKQTLLIQSSDLRNIQNIISKFVNNDGGFIDFDYKIIEIKELKIEDVFLPDSYVHIYNEK